MIKEKRKSGINMNWEKLNEADQLDEIKKVSSEHPVVIFKHSTRCSISSTALSRLERSWNNDEMKEVKAYFLDLLNHRDISSEIAEEFGVKHESPQLLVIKDGKCIYHSNHMGISYSEVTKQVLV